MASARICETSSVEPGRSTSAGAAVVEVAQLRDVGELLVGIGEGVRVAHDGAEALDELGGEGSRCFGWCLFIQLSRRG